MYRRTPRSSWLNSPGLMPLVLAASLESIGRSLAAQPLRIEIDADASEVSFVLGGNTHTVHVKIKLVGRDLPRFFRESPFELAGETD